MGDISTLSLDEKTPYEKTSYKKVPFGKQMLKQFLFDKTFKNLNHGTEVTMFIFSLLFLLIAILDSHLIPA